jgi:hypothetical protein
METTASRLIKVFVVTLMAKTTPISETPRTGTHTG